MKSNFRLCALVLALSVSGCAHESRMMLPPPGPDPQVALEVQQSNSGAPGFATTYGSNGRMYIYRFIGGNANRGNFRYKIGDGASNIHITLRADPTFAIKDVPVDGNSNGQLTATVENPTKAKIHNANTAELDAYYSVKVVDGTADIYCDPGIINNR